MILTGQATVAWRSYLYWGKLDALLMQPANRG